MMKFDALPTGDQAALKKFGLLFSETLHDPEHTFELGGWAVAFRAGILRITFFKLVGVGVAAALLGIAPTTSRFNSFGLLLAAAVNVVAAGHYLVIWRTRLQLFGGEKYFKYQAAIGGGENAGNHEKQAIFFQENLVDSYRHSDWLCTLGTQYFFLEP